MTEIKKLSENQKEQQQIKKVLESAYIEAKSLDMKNLENFGLSDEQQKMISVITKYAETQKGVSTVLITSFCKKIATPSQDVRYHKVELPDGYSGRSLDTKIITPFLLDKFGLRFAMAESGWLSRTLEQSSAYTLDYSGKITASVKCDFLNILHDIEENNAPPKKYLILQLAKMYKEKQKFDSITKNIKKIEGTIQINSLIPLLNTFFSKAGSRAPVIAVKTVLDLLVDETQRYNEMQILELESHTTSDSHSGGTGDIEIGNNKTKKIFESYEIKHEISIDQRIILNGQAKIEKNPVERYFILTTAKEVIKPDDQTKIDEIINKIFSETGCIVEILNLQHFLISNLRILKNPENFVPKFHENLVNDAKKHGSFGTETLNLWINLAEKVY